MADIVLPLDAFVRSVRANRLTPHSLFLGAGASISSGLPSAQMCIWEWKRDIFLTNNIGLESQFSELSLPSVRERIQRWLDQQGVYPEAGAPEEYSTFIEACFPIAESRRAYFAEKVRKAQPHTGYQLVGLLAEQNLIKSVWTTNFDALTARAAARFSVTPIEVAVDSRERVFRPAQQGELIVVSLHGDYRYDKLKNTSEELQQQDQALRAALVDELRRAPMVVCGYSGRDSSVMAAFSDAYSSKITGSLYWCVQDADNIPEPVADLIKLARRQGSSAHIVPIQGFDDLLMRLALHCTDEAARKRVGQVTEQSTTEPSRTAFHVEVGVPDTIIKSNAFGLQAPSEVLTCELNEWPTSHVWRWIRDQTKDREVVAVPFKGRILALGTVDDVATSFGNNVKGRIQRLAINASDFRHEEGAIVSLMRQALVRAMALETGCESDDRGELWFREVYKRGTHAGVSYLAYESVLLFFRLVDGEQHLVLKPSIRILGQAGERLERETSNPVKLAILGWQHNKEFNNAVNKWRKQLLGGANATVSYEYPPKCGSTFIFKIRRTPAFAQISSARRRSGLEIDQKFRSLLKQTGAEIEEPKLLFSNKAGTSLVGDTHPVRGIVTNRPFDYALTKQGFTSKLRLGVVCPAAETSILRTYLERHRQSLAPGTGESDYLPVFPGFSSAFGVELEVAEPGAAGWQTCNEPNAKLSDQSQSVEIGKAINRGIEILQASFSPHVVLIFFPDRWTRFRGYQTDAERFDVHDFVKASSVRRGIGTQFLEQSTLRDPLQCRVWWWLSLAFYAKALRTPWVLDGLDPDTAFVGLGISVNPGKDRDSRVVLGCSHIYSARGEGLQYRLSQVEDPVYRNRKPFLSREDARRVGEQIRELFFDSREKLPQRVVIHKRTYFTRDEQMGLREGLSGVANVEMLEIVVDDALRYVASAVDRNGKLYEDNYPVRRGTAVKLDDFTALLWVHGVTSVVDTTRRYYLGKRRIPAPLTIRRHAGQSDMKQVAEEILGLSKMNWNTFDLYTKMPATLQSSGEIARIGVLLDPFGSRSYDFRLFI